MMMVEVGGDETFAFAEEHRHEDHAYTPWDDEQFYVISVKYRS